MIKKLIVVPHSHWDREWFETFEAFRFHLVEFMDGLIQSLEHKNKIPCFLLDGQMILVEDYLAIRPEMKERIAALVRAGRLTAGPWYVQPDEFLVSGESLIRNLEIGIEMAFEMGEPMLEGYVPDTFGHIQNLPVILNGFGIDTFYTMRGLGDNLDKTGTEFIWRSADGSAVVTHFIAESYSNAGIIGATKQTTAISHGKTVSYAHLDELIERMGRWSRTDAFLLLNGSDHTALQCNLAENIESLAKEAPAALGSLGEFGAHLRKDRNSYAVIEGEMRFGRYMPVLKDVISARIYLKQMNAQAEEALLLAERFNAIASLRGFGDYSKLLQYAWKELLKNHAHDSICGCSVDRVHDNMPYRFRSALDIAAKITERTLEDIAICAAKNAQHDGDIPVVVFNPSPWERSGLTSVQIVPLVSPPLGRRIFGYSEASRDFDAGSIELRDAQGNIVPFTVDGVKVSVLDVLLRRKVLFQDAISFYAQNVPPMGSALYYARPVAKPACSIKAANQHDMTLNNGLLAVTLEHDGSLSVQDLQSGVCVKKLNSFIDEADAGDEYSFAPLSRPENISSLQLGWQLERRGDVLCARAEMKLPAALQDNRKSRSTELVRCSIETCIALEAGAKYVKIRTVFQNNAKDHRLRVCFPAGIAASCSVAETAFGLVRRPLDAEDSTNWREATSNNYVQRRFVYLVANGQGFALFNKGLPEYEAAEGGLYLTLLRAVGWLSRGDLEHRPGQVGPELPTPGAQCIGEHLYEYAFRFFDEADAGTALWRTAEELWHPLVAAACQTQRDVSTDRLPVSGSFFAIDNPNVVLSMLGTAKNALRIRLFNPNPGEESWTARLPCPMKKIRRVMLNGTELDSPAYAGGNNLSGTIPPFSVITYTLEYQ